jgi:diguanylate cyclase
VLRIYSCISEDHNLILLGVAGVLCLLATLVSSALFEEAKRSDKRRGHWLAMTAATSGIGIWATHFVAMLAYQPHLPIGYDPALTTLSFVLAVGISYAGWRIALGEGRSARPLGGAVLGIAIGSMHYVGMAAMRLPGRISWDLIFVAASFVVGIGFAVLALHFHRKSPKHIVWLPALLLMLAICGLHFTAMAAATVVPMGSYSVPRDAISNGTLSAIVTAAALIVFIVSMATLLIDRALAFQSAQESRRLRRLADASAEGLVIVDGQRIVDVNSSFLELARFSDITRLPSFVGVLFPGLNLSGIATRSIQKTIETMLVRSDGSRCAIELIVRKVEWNGEELRAIAVRDIAERKAASAQIARLVYYDPLTTLPNRSYFAEQLEERVERAAKANQELAVLLLNLDGFATVNDVHGQIAGDELLMAVAKRLSLLLPEEDLVARHGGDEFALIQHGTQPVSARALCKRIMKALEEPISIGLRAVQVGGSIGVAILPRDATDAEDLMKCAEVALFRAKSDGRGIERFYEASMDEAIRHGHQLQSDLRLAIERGQLSVHFQPIVSIATGLVTGFEALARWSHPEHGEIPPATFIPLAEQNGTIGKIGEWVLRDAVRQAVDWHDDQLTLSVNVSPVQLMHVGFVQGLERLLRRAHFDPTRLDLEVTEGLLLGNAGAAVEVLTRLAQQGITISVDDFGLGYSSLNYLRLFPFRKVKIDESFVHDMVENRTTRAIVEAIIDLSHKLGALVVAEGVETREQLALLAESRCDLVQGFLLGRPKPMKSGDRMVLVADLGADRQAA